MTVALLAVVLLIAGLFGQRQLTDLRRLPRPDPAGTPLTAEDISIVIPARNEAHNLTALLTSLRSLRTNVSQIIVVDDDSSDATYETAVGGGAHVITVTAIPPGWTGKAWACHVGTESASGRMLLFLDADTVLAPDAVDGLLALHHEHGGLVSVQPYHRVPTAYEQLSAYFNVVSLMGSGAFTHRAVRRPMAFGPCLLTTRTDYDHIGGHAAVRSDILDDAHLAAAYARADLSVRCAIGGPALQMRMYPRGLRQLTEGWTKNIASGAGRADPLSATAATVWVVAHFAIAVGAPLAIAGLPTAASSGFGPVLVWTAAWVGAALQLRGILRRIGSFRWWSWALFPVPLLAFGVLFVRSLAATYGRQSVHWRGRRVALPGRRSNVKEH